MTRVFIFMGAVRRRVPLHFEQSSGRRTTGREFSASPPLKAGSERIFLAFPLAASVTRLRLKYLLVDFTTMGSCHHRRLSPSLRPIRRAISFYRNRLYFEREHENSFSLKLFCRDFLVPSPFTRASASVRPLNLTSYKVDRSCVAFRESTLHDSFARRSIYIP